MKYPLRRLWVGWWTFLVCTSLLGEDVIQTWCSHDLSLQPLNSIAEWDIAWDQWQNEKGVCLWREASLLWWALFCFSFVLRKCWWNAAFSPSTAFRFSGRLGRKDTTAGSLDVVLQPRGSDWAGNKLLAVTQIPFSSAGLWHGVLLWAGYAGLICTGLLLCSTALGGAAWLQGRTWLGGFSWEVSAGRQRNYSLYNPVITVIIIMQIIHSLCILFLLMVTQPLLSSRKEKCIRHLS